MNNYKPYTDMIYRLTMLGIIESDEAAYPKFELYNRGEMYFKELSEAEAMIADLAEDNDDGYCFYLFDTPMNVRCYPKSGQRIRLYTSSGKLMAESKVSYVEDIEGNFELFCGRDPGDCRFKPGDLVEVCRGDRVTLEVVCSQPLSKERIASILADVDTLGAYPDYTDDCYMTLNIDGVHHHPLVIDCFPPRFPVSDRLKEKLMRVYADWKNK